MRPVKLPKMDKPEIDKLINEQFLCRIAFSGENAPYVAPFQYVLIDGQLYFHFTDYGRKIARARLVATNVGEMAVYFSEHKKF